MPSRDPVVRQQVARIGDLARSARYDGREVTSAARRDFMTRSEDEVDPGTTAATRGTGPPRAGGDASPHGAPCPPVGTIAPKDQGVNAAASAPVVILPAGAPPTPGVHLEARVGQRPLGFQYLGLAPTSWICVVLISGGLPTQTQGATWRSTLASKGRRRPGPGGLEFRPPQAEEYSTESTS
jgi:hypothetical protein